MIDKLEFRIPNGGSGPPFREEFAKEFVALRNDEANSPFSRTRFYGCVGDLRANGHDAVLHLWSRRGKIATHKLELIDCSKRTIGGIIGQAERIFAVDFFKMEISRIDFAVDVPEIPVSWFAKALAVRFKRTHANIGKHDAELAQMGGRRMETLYFGKRPNIFRIYDKKAELHKQYRAMLRKVSPDQEPPTFEETFHVPDDGQLLTRIERQIGGKIPPEYLNLHRITKNKRNLNPFLNIEFVPVRIPVALPENLSLNEECVIRQLQQLVEEHGLHWTKKYVYGKSNGQGARTWKKYEMFLQDSQAPIRFDGRTLFASFQDSLFRQLGKPDEVNAA